MKEPALGETGPWGGDGGRPWDDGVFSGIKQIYLTRKEAICSIQIEYDRNGQSVWSIKHGGDGGGSPIVVIILITLFFFFFAVHKQSFVVSRMLNKYSLVHR